MRIHVTNSAPPRIGEPDDFGRFEVVVESSMTDDQLGRQLSLMGQPTDDLAHVFVDPAWVRAQVGEVAQSDEWQTSWKGLEDFAEAHGWTDTSGRIRAHVDLWQANGPVVTTVTGRGDMSP